MRKFIGKMKLINELRLDLFVIIVWHTLVGMTIVGFIYNTSRANYIITLIDIYFKGRVSWWNRTHFIKVSGY